MTDRKHGRHADARPLVVGAFELERLEPRMFLTIAIGSEFLINTTTSDSQDAGSPIAVSMAADGSFVAVWESDDQDSPNTWGVYAQRFDASGAKLGPEILVNSSSLLSDQRLPSVAVADDGDFVVVWHGLGLLGLLDGIHGQRFDASGNAQGGEFRISESLLLDQANASVAMDPDGNFVVVWESIGQDSGGSTGIYARRYAANGTALGGEFLVNQTTSLNQTRPALAVSDSGAFVITWRGNGTAESGGSFVRVYDATGNATTGEILVNETTSGAQTNPSVAMNSADGFIVVWNGNGPGDSGGVLLRMFDAAGNPLTSETPVNVTTSSTQSNPAIWVDSDDDFLVVWSGNGPSDGSGIFAREYAADGTPRTGEFILNTTTASTQSLPSVAGAGNNAYVATWSGNGAGDGDGFFGRLLTNVPPSVAATSAALAYVEGDGAVVVDGALTLSDADDETLSGAVAVITSNYIDTEDLLSFTDQLGITGSWDSMTGTLTLSGTASVASYQAALRSITYSNSSADPDPSTRTVEFTVVDVMASGSDSRDITVSAANDVPTVTTTSGTLSYAEDSGPVVIDDGITVSDADDLVLVGATIAVSAGYIAGEDILSFTDQAGITGSWNALMGMLTLSGAASIAAYQAALRSVAYTNSSDDPDTSARTISFQVDDGTDASAAATRDVAITASNDAPVVTASSIPLAYDENDGPVVIDAALTISDADDAILAGATIAIASNYVPGEDFLSFTDQAGIIGSWNSLTGTLTLSGAASIAAYQAALRSITYTNASDDPDTSTRTVSFIVDDGTDTSTADARDITIAAANDVPVITTTSAPLDYAENSGAIALDPGLVLADPDGTLLSGAVVEIGGYVAGQDLLSFTDQAGIIGSWNSLTGVLTLSGVASITAYQAALRSIAYTNSSDDPATTTRTVSFTVNDGTDASAAALRDIALTASNDPPSVAATPAPLAYAENDGPVILDPGLSLTDLDDATLVGATIVIASGYVAGEDLISFTDQSGITGAWNALTGTLTLSGVATLTEYQAALRSITYTNLSDDPSVTSRSVSFIVDDGSDASSAASRTITVTAYNDPPVVTTTAAPLSYAENAGAIPVDSGLSLTDLDDGTLASATIAIIAGYVTGQDLLSFTAQAGITGSWNSLTAILTLSGVASVAAYRSALRSITYSNSSDDPNTEARTISFVVSDGTDASAAATRQVLITASNDAPVAIGTSEPLVYTENDGLRLLDPWLSLHDLDDASLAGAVVAIEAGFVSGEDALSFVDQLGITGSWNPVTGTLTLAGAASIASYQIALRSIVYSNTSEDPGPSPRTITFVVSDGTDSSNAAARPITIAPVNDRPVVSGTAPPLSYLENSGGVPIDSGLSLADSDDLLLSGALIAITLGHAPGEDLLVFLDQGGITGTWNPATGTLTLAGAATIAAYQVALRSITYHNPSDHPSDTPRTIAWSVSDGADESALITRTITIAAVNDAPVVAATAAPLTYTENQGPAFLDPGLTLSDLDSVTLAGATISISSGYAIGQESLSFAAGFGIAASWDASSGTLILSGAASVAVYQLALRSVAYSNSSEDPVGGLRTFSITVTDGLDPSNTAMRNAILAPTNDGPVATTSAGSIDYSENAGPIAIDPALTLLDLDDAALIGAAISISAGFTSGQDLLVFSDQLGITGVWNSATGALILTGLASIADYEAAMRSITYTNTSDAPDPSPRTLSIIVGDGSGESAPATRTIFITPSNDAPVTTGSGAPISYTENAPAIPLAGIAIADPDDDVLVGATVWLSSGFSAGEDLLIFSEQLGIVGSWDGAAGILSLSGHAAMASYELALAAVAYANTSDDPSTSSRAISISVTDGLAWSAAFTSTLDVIAVNDAPVISADPFPILYTGLDGAVLLDPTITLVDPDSSSIVGATIVLSANYSPDEDSLLFQDAFGITGAWDAPTATLTLAGAASLADYQAALRSIAYANSSREPSLATRTATVSVTDEAGATTSGERDIVLQAAEDPMDALGPVHAPQDLVAPAQDGPAINRQALYWAAATLPAATSVVGAGADDAAIPMPNESEKAPNQELSAATDESGAPASEKPVVEAPAPDPPEEPASADEAIPSPSGPPPVSVAEPPVELPAASPLIAGPVHLTSAAPELVSAITQVTDDLRAHAVAGRIENAVVATVAGGLAVGYVTLCAKAGAFNALAALTMPTRTGLDPAQILDAFDRAKSERRFFRGLSRP